MNIQDKMQEIHHKYGVTEMANYKIQLFVDNLIKTEKEQLRLYIVSQQRELFSDLLTKLKEENMCSVAGDELIDNYFESLNCD